MQIYFEKEEKGEEKGELATQETWAPSSLLATSPNYDKHAPTSSTDPSTAPTLGEILLGNSAAAVAVAVAAAVAAADDDTPAQPQNTIANVEGIMKRARREIRAIIKNIY